MTDVTADFTEVTRRYMEERGTSLRALAKQAGYDPSYLSKVLRGLKPCGPKMADDLDKALNAGGEIIRAAKLLDLCLATGQVDYVAPELADYFASQLAGHYTADRFLGPTRLLPPAVSQYELLCDVASDASGSLRGNLWSLAAGFAALIGWLYQDAGDLAASSRWHDVMIERAHRSSDAQLVAFALHCKAMLHADMADGRGVLDLTGTALRHKGLCPKVRVLLLQQAAHGTSLIGGNDAASTCDRLLDEAASLVDTIADEYPWGGSSRTDRYIDVQRATVYTRLGRTDEALNLWGQIIPAIPAASRRDLGVFRARQAQALANAGEPEQAVDIALQVVPIAAQTASARMLTELSMLRQRMEPWRTEPPGRALATALAGIPRKQRTGGR